MTSLTIPKIFFNSWFWFALIAIIIAIHYFWGKTPSPPKPSKFLTKHKKIIYKIGDIFLISIVLFGWVPIIYMSTSIALKSVFNLSSTLEPLPESLRFALAFFLMPAIPISGVSAMLIGLLPVFQSNLTKVKRIILLTISLLPIVFAVLLLLTSPIEKPAYTWSVIKLGLGFMLGCWLINGPAIIIGKHFLPVTWTIMRALLWVSGDYPW